MPMLRDNVFWWPEHRLLLDWSPKVTFKILHYPDRSAELAHLILAHYPLKQPGRLVVIKDRWQLLAHKEMLSEVFDEFQILDDGWRGAIQLSESDYMRFQLMQ